MVVAMMLPAPKPGTKISVKLTSRAHRDGSRPYGVDYRSITGKRARISIGTKKEAEIAAARLRVEAFEAKALGRPASRQITLAELKTLHIARKRRRKAIAHDEYRWQALLDHFGQDRLVNTILPSDVDRFVKSLQGRITRLGRAPSPATINHYLALLRRAMNVARKERAITENPVLPEMLFDEANERDRTCSDSEFSKLMAAANPHMCVAIALARWTGMRCGEIAELDWSRIDLEKRVARLGPTKGDRGRSVGRSVPIAKPAAEMLRAWQSWTGKTTGKLFHCCSGTLSSNFGDLTERVGIEDLRFHDFRHTAATWMRRAMKIDLLTLKRIFGWKSWKMVERYSHVGEDEISEVAARL